MRDIKKVGYKVNVRYMDFYFNSLSEAAAFAQAAYTAVEGDSDPHISIEFEYPEEDEEEENEAD